jgi:crotonobetainyl-CoA:carnitine CoA-transferase CaiB-like acyl-CoA transferase
VSERATPPGTGPGALDGLRVLDLSTVVAGPVIARNLGDHGAEVVKVEHPIHGDPARQMGWQVAAPDDPEGERHSLWWKSLARNKLPITLDLKSARGAALCLQLAARSDVLVESFRPGTLERWGLGPDVLHAANPELVLVRVSGFGQTGPYADRPGFGTLAEAMSGWAGAQGTEDGPPQLPAVALADEAAGVWGTMAALLALLARERRPSGAPPGGQVIDVSLHEPLLSMLGPLPALYDATGEEAPRLGNRLPFAAPRGAYRCSDGRWFALSGTSPAAAHRVLRAIDRPELVEDRRFATNTDRLANAVELDGLIADWAAARPRDDALAAMAAHDAAASPIYRMGDLLTDPHVVARGSISRVPDADLGQVAMPALTPRLSATPGALRWTGGARGAANDRIFGDLLGLDPQERAALAADGVI